MEALHEVDAHLRRGFERARVFHLLGDHLEVERARELDHRRHHRLVDRVDAEIADERAVDLQIVERQVLQVAERGQAAPEIVERELAAHAVQHADEALRMLDVRDDRVLGDFERKLVRRDAGAVEHVDDELQERRIAERLSREVDRETAIRRQPNAAARAP